METSALPPLYATWIQQLLQGPLPLEPRATCSDCAMCKKLEPESSIEIYFKPSTKCCTYNPPLPNFLVGGILQDLDPDFSRGRAKFESEAVRAAISPLGVGPTWQYRLLQSLKTFGQSEILLCPYYMDEQGGICGIWRYRNSICSTWFCKHEHGFRSTLFWNCLEQLLTKLQVIIAKWAAEKLGIPATADNANQTLWTEWLGQEREYYIACFHEVAALNWIQVQDISGAQIQSLVDAVLSAFQQLVNSNVIPESLVLGKWEMQELPDGLVRIRSHNPYDTIDLPKKIIDLLPQCVGQPWNEMLSFLKKETTMEIDASLIHKLWEYRMLIDE